MAQKDSNQSGQSIVIMAFAVVVLMGIMAVAIDGGRIYTLRRDAQNAADAAALQGAKALCQDEDFEAKALEIAAINGFSGAGVIEVNNPPIHSDSATNDDQVEVVITATIQGGMIAPVVYEGELNTRVKAVGDCIRGTLSGSGSAIFAGGQCPTAEASVTGSNVSIIGGIHSNGNIQVNSQASNPGSITGTVSYNEGGAAIQNATLFPTTNNPVHVTFRQYPLDLVYADFVWAAEPYSNGEDGWAYKAIMDAYPDGSRYHYYSGQIDRTYLEGEGLLIGGNLMAKGVYVSPVGFKLNGMGGVIGDDVTFVSLNKIEVSGNDSTFRPYFGGLLAMSDGFGNPCGNNEVISLTGSNINWGGIVFAPNGSIKLSSSGGGTFYGSLIGGQVSLSGSNLQVIYDPSFLPPDPDTIELGE